MQELLQTLCALDGASGEEDSVRNYLRRAAESFADSIRTDALGNLIVSKKGKKPAPHALLLAAHMDEVGLLLRAITEEGYLKFTTLGGIDRRVLLGKRVWVGEQRLPGIVGLAAYHLGAADERSRIPKLTDLFIDIGVESREEAEALCGLGDTIVFDGPSAAFGAGLLRAKAIDDRLGCAVLLMLLQRPLPLDVSFAFTVQEEVGTRGAFGAAFSEQPELALVIEGTTAADLPNLEADQKVCLPGHGVVIPFMDGATVYDRGLFELLRDLAIQHDIPWQTKHRIAGGTDAGTIQRSRAGIRVAGLSAAMRYLHTPQSIVSLQDCADMLRLAEHFIAAVAEQR